MKIEGKVLKWQDNELKYLDDNYLLRNGEKYEIIDIPYHARIILKNEENKEISIDFEIDKKMKKFVYENYPQKII